ncbi:MAG: SurA N-terminal domain-containing protein [Gammaproteobacteria bacterium]
MPQVEFQRVYQNRLIAEQQAASGNLPPAAQELLKRQALNSLVLNRVVSQYVHDSGFRISAARVIEHVQELPVFQVGGQFSKAAYDATLASQGISPTAFEREQRDNLAIRQLQEGLSESGFFTTREYRRLIALDLQRRDVAYAILDPQVLGADIKISDAEVQVYYAANTAQFQTTESADLDYLEVNLADMARNYQPDEAALRAAYDADPTRFRAAEERHARHILITTEKTGTMLRPKRWPRISRVSYARAQISASWQPSTRAIQVLLPRAVIWALPDAELLWGRLRTLSGRSSPVKHQPR